MNIDTTINITTSNKKLIERYAKKLGTSKSKLVLKLISKFLKKHTLEDKTFIQVAYQKRDLHANWTKLHLWVNCAFYEKCIDLRKFCKKSLSSIVAIAIKKHLQETIENKTDNYPVNYFIFYTKIGNSNLITINWGEYEEKIIKKINKMHKRE